MFINKIEHLYSNSLRKPPPSHLQLSALPSKYQDAYLNQAVYP